MVNIYRENVKAFQNYEVIRKNNGYRRRLFRLCHEQEIFVTGNNVETDEELFITSELELNSDNEEENIINKRPRPGQKRKRLLLTNTSKLRSIWNNLERNKWKFQTWQNTSS